MDLLRMPITQIVTIRKMLTKDFNEKMDSNTKEIKPEVRIPNLEELKLELMSTSAKPKFIISPSAFIRSYSRDNNKYITDISDESIQKSLIDVSDLYLHDTLSIIKGLIMEWGIHDYFAIVMEDSDGKIFNNIICYNPNNENYDEQYKFY